MKSPFSLLLLLAVVALVGSSCSSTTTIETADGLLAEPTGAPLDAPTPEPTAESTPAQTAEPTGADAPDDGDAGNTADTEDGIFGIGGSDQIDSLVTDCQAGSDQACDILYQVTTDGSAEEAVAIDCGGRGEAIETLFCTAGVRGAIGSLYFDEESKALPGIADDCESGDMTACDFLFFRSPVGSEYEAMGNTCAGLIEVALPDCRTQFGDS